MSTALHSVFALALCALSALTLRAQEAPAAEAEVLTPLDPAVAIAPDDSLDRALLWRIDAPGAKAPSYLFGTIHLIDAEDFLISDSLMTVLNRTDRVVFEIDPAEMQNPMVAMSLMQQAMMSGGQTLRDLLEADEYARVDAHFSDMGLPMMLLERVKPMFLSMLAGLDPSDMGGMMGGFGGEGGDGEATIKSYEMELDAIARETEKEVGGLETTAFQLSLFDSIPLPDQADMLMAAIDAPDGEEDELSRLTRVYVTGDVDGMYAMSVGEEGGLGGFERMLIVNRNRNWIAPMLEQAAAGPTLFAVGAGHLGGPEGVIRLLRAEGAEVEAVSVR